MSLSVEIEPKSEYLLVNVTGQYDLDEAVERFAEVVFACRKHDLNKVLVDYRTLEGETAKVQEIIYALRGGEFYRQHLEAGGVPLKMAYVSNDKHILSWTPGSDMAEKFGLEVFRTTDLNQAIEWLSS